jgi:hypothetical protein
MVFPRLRRTRAAAVLFAATIIFAQVAWASSKSDAPSLANLSLDELDAQLQVTPPLNSPKPQKHL